MDKTEPMVWDIPAEPGPQYRKLRDEDNDAWWRVPDDLVRERDGVPCRWLLQNREEPDWASYRTGKMPLGASSWVDVMEYAPITDATHELEAPPAALAAGHPLDDVDGTFDYLNGRLRRRAEGADRLTRRYGQIGMPATGADR